MSNTVLITGANGRLGQAAISGFAAKGWTIQTLTRSSTLDKPDVSAMSNQPTSKHFTGDVRDYDAFHKAALGCDVIVHAANPSYEFWATEVLPSITTLVNVAHSVGATIVMPGNIYSYGESMPPLLSQDTPKSPSCEHGELRAQLENQLAAAAKDRQVQTILVRAGSYLDGRDTGNWFETHMCKALNKGEFMYPGPTDVACEWVYLPDVADVMVSLATMRSELSHFEDIGLAGFSVTGETLYRAVEKQVGQSLTLKSLPWFAVRVMSWFQPKMKGVYDLRYLFFVPHAIDGTRLNAILPHWRSKSLNETMELISQEPLCLSSSSDSERTHSDPVGWG